MSGFFHLFSGLVAGLLIWKVRAPRWSLSLAFVFAFNAWLGPDLRGAIKPLAKALNSPEISHFAVSIHTYVGWAIFSIGWSLLFYGIIRLLEMGRKSRNIQTNGHSLVDVFLAVCSAGLFHLGVDTFGNLNMGELYADGVEVFYPKMETDMLVVEPDAFVSFAVVVSIALVAGLAVKLSRLGRNFEGARIGISTKHTGIITAFGDWLKRSIKSKELLIFACAMMLVVGNLALAILSTYGRHEFMITREDRKTGYIASIIIFNVGNALEASKFPDMGDVHWYPAVLTVAFIVIFIIVHVRGLEVTLKKKRLPLDVLVILVYLAVMLVSYAIQPWIGNLSGNEADVGSLMYFFINLLTPVLLVMLVPVRSRAKPAGKTDEWKHDGALPHVQA